ncbi:MAG: polysaccharide biosynthesis protein, partial [Actinomycetota bacterium]
DLARQLANLMRPGTPIEYTGLRPGEKLHEVLVATDEIGTARVHPRIIHAPASTGSAIDALDVFEPELRRESERLLEDRWAMAGGR